MIVSWDKFVNTNSIQSSAVLLGMLTHCKLSGICGNKDCRRIIRYLCFIRTGGAATFWWNPCWSYYIMQWFTQGQLCKWLVNRYLSNYKSNIIWKCFLYVQCTHFHIPVIFIELWKIAVWIIFENLDWNWRGNQIKTWLKIQIIHSRYLNFWLDCILIYS